MTTTTILCDLDGTLVDSRQDIAVAFQHAWRTVVGGIPPSATAIAQHIGKPLAKIVSELGGILTTSPLSHLLHPSLPWGYPHLTGLVHLHARRRHHQRVRASGVRLAAARPHPLLPAHPGWSPWSAPPARPRPHTGGPRRITLCAIARPDGRRYPCRCPGREGGWHQDLCRHLWLWHAGSAVAVRAGPCHRQLWRVSGSRARIARLRRRLSGIGVFT